MRRTIFSVATAIGLILSGAAWAEINIAAAGPMTGQYALLGEQMRLGAEQAVADINANGGVLGELLSLTFGDDSCNADQVDEVANNISGNGVVFVAGHICSSASILAANVYSENGIIQISPASTNPKLTDERPGGINGGTYRVGARDDQQGIAAGAYLNANFGDKKVAFIHDKSGYGKGLADAAMAAFEARGGSPVHYDFFTAGERDYSALVTTLKQLDIDALYIGGYHTEVGLIVSLMRNEGMDTKVVSGDALMTYEYWAIAGEAGEGTVMTLIPDPTKHPQAAEVVGTLQDAGNMADGYVLQTYAAIQVWAQAAEEAGSTNFDAVRMAINSGSFKTVLGNLEFDEKGDVSLPGYAIHEWSSGDYKPSN